ncbi:MAG: hypothetical protein LBI99_03870 [Propionibacteriaceae bacterium]|jgi:hypothetical protein|nr:hypothetical protein [Propionibacteriaceae bacterium]
MMLKSPKSIAAIPLIGALFLFAGCTFTIAVPDSPTPAPVVVDDPQQSPSEAIEDPLPPPANSSSVTPPGTELNMSETATVPFKYGTDPAQNIQVSILGIRKGSTADFAGFDDKSKKSLADVTPFYVDISAQAAPGADTSALAYATISSSQIGALDQDGDKIQPLIIMGNFEPCDSGSFGKDGAEFKGCIAFGATSAQTLTLVTWADVSYTESGYDSLDGQPIVWK